MRSYKLSRCIATVPCRHDKKRMQNRHLPRKSLPHEWVLQLIHSERRVVSMPIALREAAVRGIRPIALLVMLRARVARLILLLAVLGRLWLQDLSEWVGAGQST